MFGVNYFLFVSSGSDHSQGKVIFADVMQNIKASALTTVKYTNYMRYFTIFI